MPIINTQTVQTVQQVATIYTKPGQTTAVVNDAVQAANSGSNQNNFNATLSAAQLADAIATSIGKSLPSGASEAVAATSLGNNIGQIIVQLQAGDKVNVNLVEQAAADIASLASGVALAGAVALSSPAAAGAAAGIGAALILASGALTIVAVASNGTAVSPSMQQALESLYQSSQSLLNNASAMSDSILQGIIDISKSIGEGLLDFLIPSAYGEIAPTTSTDFNAARAWAAPRFDPLILDLNGSGIETVAPNAATPILYDLNGDGIKTGTGWVAATDGFLVLDRNGNGTIDNGTELFGDSTQLAAGGTAADGFAALAGQDSNFDGVVNALDANFANLQVWQDLNQDGISQAGELKTLTELGIASLNLAKTANSQTLTGGNQIADLGSFTRADGTTAVMADVSGRVATQQRGTHRPTPSGWNLASDAFHRSFTDLIPTNALSAALPDMQGSGAVRDLKQAASLQSVEGVVLASALGQYAASATRNDQLARLDTLLADWAANDAVFEMRRVG